MKRLLFILILITVISASPKLSNSEINTEIKDMIFQTARNITYKILSISEPVDNITAVAILPPYREFPNVLLFQYKNNKWSRVFECLSIGIQDNQSDTLDLHTVGEGIDFTIGGKNEYSFDEETKKLIDKSLSSSEAILIPYKNFMHMHISGKSPYTIDKTKFYDLANILHNRKYEKYSSKDCMMYDLPKLKSIKLVFDNEKYILDCQTINGQIWKITFDNIDENNKFLVNKEIQVK